VLVSIILVAAVAAIVGLGVALTMRSKQDFAAANEVVPGVTSAAPASWAGAHSPEAKLHRRLGAAVRSARANPRLVELGLAPQTQQIEAEALAIDERLVAAAALPARHRVEAVAAFESHVAGLEDAVAALIASTTVGDSKELLEQAVSEADIKLQALAQARAEVEHADRLGRGTLSATDQESTSSAASPEAEPGGATS
jgi:hypothetical protein